MADCDAHAANAHSTLNQHTTKVHHVGDTNHDADTEDYNELTLPRQSVLRTS